MATPNRIYSLSLGMQTVSLAEFRTGSGGGLVLSAFERQQLLPDPSADATRPGQIKIVLSELREKLGLKRQTVNYAIAAQSVFTRFVKLPSVGETQIDQIITFEAQQNVPFPIEEVVWDYQLVGGERDGKMEVVLVAIKSDLLNDLNGSVEEASFDTGIVDVAPLALYNAFRYNYSDIGGCSLLIDIGARTTNLIFIEAGKVFSRSIPIGGSTITQAISKDIEEPMMAAEERKKRDAFVSLGGSYAEPEDPNVARVSKIVRNTMTRLHAEISRSVSFYRAQQQGGAPTQAYLCGGSSGMPYTREFFSEKLRIPVEFFNALRNVTVDSSMESEIASKNAHVLGELVGLALRSTSECPMELNLQPDSVERRKELSQRRPYLVMAAVCLLLALGGWWLYFLKAGEVETTVLGELQPKVSQLAGIEGRFKAVEKEIAEQRKIAQPFIEAVNERDYWVTVIDDLNQRLPATRVWVTLLEPGFFSTDGKFSTLDSERGSAGARTAVPGPPGSKAAVPAPGLSVKGLYLFYLELGEQGSPRVVDEFVQKLAESPYFDIDQNDKNWVVPVRQTPTQTEWAYPFELRLKLKNPPFAK